MSGSLSHAAANQLRRERYRQATAFGDRNEGPELTCLQRGPFLCHAHQTSTRSLPTARPSASTTPTPPSSGPPRHNSSARDQRLIASVQGRSGHCQSHEVIPGQERRGDHRVRAVDDQSSSSCSCSIARGQLQRRQEQVVLSAIDGLANQARTNQLGADACLSHGEQLNCDWPW